MWKWKSYNDKHDSVIELTGILPNYVSSDVSETFGKHSSRMILAKRNSRNRYSGENLSGHVFVKRIGTAWPSKKKFLDLKLTVRVLSNSRSHHL